MTLKDNLNYEIEDNSNVESENLVDDILKIESDINKLQMIFLDNNSKLDKFEIVNQILFNKNKLEVLSKVISNENLKVKCDSILNNVINFMLKYNLEGYNLKLKTFNLFSDLTKHDNQISYLKTKKELCELAITLTLEDDSHELINFINTLDFPDLNLYLMIKDLRDNNMGIFKNINSFFKKEKAIEENELNLNEKEKIIEGLLDSLFNFISKSYEINKKPFTKDEKIMIVGIIIDIQEYLS